MSSRRNHTSPIAPLARPRWQRLSVYSVTALVTLGSGGLRQCVPVPPPAETVSVDARTTECIDRTNAERAAAGLGGVTLNAQLVNAAQRQSNSQAAQDQISHDGPDGSTPKTRIEAEGYDWQTYGENVAAEYATCGEAFTGWMNSEGHRANVLLAGANEIGMGVATSADGTAYWTMIVAARR
jgi:uncharacterized protein YkwD